MAEEEALRMAALKKAYAEIILNASKEAAARIMVSDRKALCLEQDLFSVKKDSLHMLLRLKQMLDCKTAEVEVKSLSEQRKIEELEAQLSEAEGVIVDLREELGQVRDKVEMEKCNLIPPLSNHHTRNEHTNLNAAEVDKDSPPKTKVEAIAITNLGQCLTSKHFSTEGPAKAGETIKSLHKEIEPHPGEAFTLCQPLTESDDQVKSNKEPCSTSSSDSDGKGGGKTSSLGIQVEPMEDGSGGSFQSRRPSCRRPRNNMKYHEAIAALRRTSRGPRAKASVSRCSTFSVDSAKSEAKEVHPNSRSDDSSVIAEMNHHNTTCDIAKVVSPVLKIVSGGEVGSGEGSSNHTDVLMTEPDSHVMEVVEGAKEMGSSRAADETFFKYIFQRKCKKEALFRLDENTVPRKSVKHSDLEDQKDISMMNSSILTDQQSNDTQDLLQIAHQLVSLSENGR